jgi:hypothetical protein
LFLNAVMVVGKGLSFRAQLCESTMEHKLSIFE